MEVVLAFGLVEKAAVMGGAVVQAVERLAAPRLQRSTWPFDPA
jgi:hypothetical protein